MPIIAVHDDGTIEYTRDKELYGMFNNRGEMQRVTDILKFKHNGDYYFVWLAGPYKDSVHSNRIHADIYNEAADNPTPHGIVVFDTYEAVVDYERKTLNKLRERGVRFSK